MVLISIYCGDPKEHPRFNAGLVQRKCYQQTTHITMQRGARDTPSHLDFVFMRVIKQASCATWQHSCGPAFSRWRSLRPFGSRGFFCGMALCVCMCVANGLLKWDTESEVCKLMYTKQGTEQRTEYSNTKKRALIFAFCTHSIKWAPYSPPLVSLEFPTVLNSLPSPSFLCDASVSPGDQSHAEGVQPLPSLGLEPYSPLLWMSPSHHLLHSALPENTKQTNTSINEYFNWASSWYAF